MGNALTTIDAALGQVEAKGETVQGIYVSVPLWHEIAGEAEPWKATPDSPVKVHGHLLHVDNSFDERSGCLQVLGKNGKYRFPFSVDPELGPYAEITTARESTDGGWAAFDAEGNYLLDLEGLDQLVDLGLTVVVQGPLAEIESADHHAEPARVLIDKPTHTRNKQAPLEVDGITLEVGDRVLVVNQPDPDKNGVYVVGSSGNDGWSGGTWMKSQADTRGHLVKVETGLRHRDGIWYNYMNGAWQKVETSESSSQPNAPDFSSAVNDFFV